MAHGRNRLLDSLMVNIGYVGKMPGNLDPYAWGIVEVFIYNPTEQKIGEPYSLIGS